MPKYDWENRKYDDGTYTFLWSMPRLDKRKDIYRCVLRGDCLSVKDGKVEITIPRQQHTDAEYQRRIIQKISAAIFAAAQQTTAYSLNTVLFSDNNWETVRKFHAWSTNTARSYQNILQDVFAPILEMSFKKIKSSDVITAVDAKRKRCEYKESTIRTWYKVINRVYVYLQTVHPGTKNPVRMRSEAYDAARQRQRAATAEHRTNQTALDDIQQKMMLRAFLEDIRNGVYRGVAGITMLESGRRPSEAGATTLGMHVRPQGEEFYTAPCYAVAETGIVDRHKSHRSDRQIPDSPILAAVYEYVAAQIKEKTASDARLNWEVIPFGCRLTQRPDGTVDIRPFSPKQISAYVRHKLAENKITFLVAVDKSEDDSDDNRRAYVLRYTAATDLFRYLPLDQYQYVMGHHRSTTGRGAETSDARVYSSPQIQHKIYCGMCHRSEDVYGKDILSEIHNLLYGTHT